MAKKAKTVRERVEENHKDWTDTVQGMTIEQIDTMILRFAKYREEIKEAKKNDPELEKVTLLRKELAAPYAESLKANEEKTKYLLLLLEEKGGNTSGDPA